MAVCRLTAATAANTRRRAGVDCWDETRDAKRYDGARCAAGVLLRTQEAETRPRAAWRMRDDGMGVSAYTAADHTR